MFKAIKGNDGTRVTSIDPEWQARGEELRAMAAADNLICPGCKQPLRYRAGEIRRPHFAHRNLSDCPLDRQSPEVVEGKAQLYLWLKSKYVDQVEVDVDLAIPGWDRPADVVVRRDGQDTLAYWIFDRGPRNRTDLLYAMPDGIKRQVLFTETARLAHAKEPAHLIVSAALRDFIVRGKYDEPHGGKGHLQFLDTRTSRVAIYRGLHCIHSPAIYASAMIAEADLKDALINPKTGEVVLQQDSERYSTWEQRLATRTPNRPAYSVAEWARPAKSSLAQPITGGPPEPAGADVNSTLLCERCGNMTEAKDWVYGTPSKGICVCRACLTRRQP